MLVGHAVNDDSIVILVHVENVASVVLDLEFLLDRLVVLMEILVVGMSAMLLQWVICLTMPQYLTKIYLIGVLQI